MFYMISLIFCDIFFLCRKEEKKYDIVFDDLTDVPLYSGSNMWQFIFQLINQAMAILPIGKFLYFDQKYKN